MSTRSITHKRKALIIGIAASLLLSCIGFAQTQQSQDPCSLERLPSEMQAYLKTQPQSFREQMRQHCLEFNKKLEAGKNNPDSPYAKRLYNEKVALLARDIWSKEEWNNETVQLSFDILPSGKLHNIKIHKSSGKPNVDKQALNTLLAAPRFESYQSKMQTSRKFLLRALPKRVTIIPIEPADKRALTGDVESSINTALQKESLPFSEKFFATFLLKVNQDGQIQNTTLHHSSGNKSLNETLLNIVRQSGPFLPYSSHHQDSIGFYIFVSGYVPKQEKGLRPRAPHIEAQVEELDSDGLKTTHTSTDLAWGIERALNFYTNELITQPPSLVAAYDFTVLPNGQLSNIQFHKDPTNNTLNAKALSILKNAAPFKPYTSNNEDGLQKFRIYLGREKNALYRMSFPNSIGLTDVNDRQGCCMGGTYSMAVFDLLRETWAPPQYPQASPVYVTFRLDPSGHLQTLNLDASSGVAALDKYTLKTIRDLAPFPTYTTPQNKPFVQFSLSMTAPGMQGRDSWSYLKSDQYSFFKGNYQGEKQPDSATYIKLDTKSTKQNLGYEKTKNQIQAALQRQLKTMNQKPTLPPEITANAILRNRMTALLDKARTPPLGPGTAIVRFTVAQDGHPVAIHTVKAVGNKTIPYHEEHLARNAEMVIFTGGPYQLPASHYEITLTYP